LRWLAQREHSRAELGAKLLAHARAEALAEAQVGVQVAAAPAARVEQVLDWLEEHRYLSQRRFVESRVRLREARYGNLRIQQELRRHELELSAAEDRALGASELDRARAVHRRKFARVPDDAAEYARQARFLARRGFSTETVRSVLRSARDAPAGGEPMLEQSSD
jgi:regulatory protein